MSIHGAPKPQWEVLAEKFEALIAAPTVKQNQLAATLGIVLPGDTPAPVAAVILREHLHEELLESQRAADGIPEVLHDIEDELGLTTRAQLITGTRAELSAWFASRYLLKTARGLRELRPQPGDVVNTALGRRIISSVGGDGAVHFRGRGRAWPNHVVALSRVGDADHASSMNAVHAALRNAETVRSTNFARFAEIEQYRLEPDGPSPQAVRALEEQLDAGERLEEPLQQTLTRHPNLLACLVVGGWRTYVIPKQALGRQYVTDFLVLGINSLGPQWVAVELEAARHTIVNRRTGRLTQAARHAADQIQDWREWLTTNIAHAESELGLYGINNRVTGLVVIGRDTPSAVRQASRQQVADAEGTSIHSWDWLARAARDRMENSLHISDFARAGAAALGFPTEAPAQRSLAEIEDDPDIDLDELLAAD